MSRSEWREVKAGELLSCAPCCGPGGVGSCPHGGKIAKGERCLCENVHWNTGNTTGISFFYYHSDCGAGRQAHAL